MSLPLLVRFEKQFPLRYYGSVFLLIDQTGISILITVFHHSLHDDLCLYVLP